MKAKRQYCAICGRAKYLHRLKSLRKDHWFSRSNLTPSQVKFDKEWAKSMGVK